MKRPKATAAVVLAVAAALLWAGAQSMAPPAPARAGNILANPGFEEEKNDLPAGWSFDERSRQSGRIGLTSKAASGARALMLQPNASNADDWRALNVAQGFQSGPIAGKTLELSAALAAEDDATAVFAVWAIDRAGAIQQSAQVTSSGTVYARQTTTLSLPVDSRARLLIVACRALGRRGAAYFDDVKVELAPDAPRAQAPASGSPLHAEVSVDATRVVRSIPRTLYGHNLTWPWGGAMIFDFRTGALSEELVRLTRELDVSLLRFPGGSFADFYHWRDGIGSQDARKETAPQPGNSPSKHSFGTDEALTFAERTGARLLVTVNAHTGTPQEAADWVRYVNGQAPPRRVELWEIGNEFYIKNDDLANAAIPPEEYARRFLAFAQAMRKADASIKLIGIGGENFGRYDSNHYPEWNRKLLSQAGSQMDYLALHNAYFPAVLADQGLTDVRQVYAAMLAAPVLIKGNLDTVAGQIERFAPGRPIKIAITEWGPIFHFDLKSPWVDHVKTLGSALFVASTMKVFLEHPAVEIANAFKLNDVGFMGWIGARYADHLKRPAADGQYLPTAPYLAFQLFTRHFGSRVVTTSASGPSYDSTAVGMTAAVKGVPYLDVVSSLSDDGDRLYLIAVNKNFDQAIEARVTLQGFRPSGSGTARTLQGTGLDANTGTRMIEGVSMAPQVEDRSNPRLRRGGPDEVTVTTATVAVSDPFRYSFPPHSVTALELEGQAQGRSRPAAPRP